MAGYHDIVLPDKFSQGSQMQVSYDTRITQLESGVETRLSRYRPEGRRRYSVLRGIASGADVLELYEFYILRQGALNSFKFRDWMDFATNPSRETFSSGHVPVSAFDHPLSPVTGRTYQLVTIYQDAARTITRPLHKIVIGTEEIAVNGAPLVPAQYTINTESGEVTIDGSLGTINSITGGCQFYTTVRFAESTDEAFNVAMQATLDTQSLPGFDLVEDVAPDGVSQDYQYGGSHFYTNVVGTIRLLEVQGRLQVFTTAGASAAVILPNSFNIPTGGPIFVLHNSISSTDTLAVKDQASTTIATVAIGSTAEVYLANASGSDLWVVVT